MKNLRGRNAIVTGGSYGIGPQLAKALAQEGVNVALTARSGDKLKEVVKSLSGLGVKIIAIPADVTQEAERRELLARTEAELGPVDLLVNNASIHLAGEFTDRSPDEINQIIETNLTASILLTRAVLPKMLERGTGHIVHSASLAGKVGMPYMAVYSATKYGIVGFNHALQAELRGTGVRSTAMCWGFISQTGMWARFQRPVHVAFGTTPPEKLAKLLIRAIKHDWVERVVNPIPVQPVMVMWTLAPRWASQTFKLLRVEKFMQAMGQIATEDRSVLSPP
jgi:short-subunit dehydrogenase